LPNDSEFGDTPSTGVRTVPVSDTDGDVAGAATFTVTDALLVTAAPVGLKVTLIVQLEPTAKLAPQLFV
jgi:hypothetical protein